MANFYPKLFKAASQAEVMPVSTERSDEPFESPVFEDYLAKNDIAGYMTALWKGVAARDAESMRVLFYLSVQDEELDNATTLLDMLLDMDDEYALSFWHFMEPKYKMMEKSGKHDLDEMQSAFNVSLSLGDATYLDLYPDYKSLFDRFGDSETTLLRAYINNVGRIVEPQISKEKEIEINPCAPEDKKDDWRSLYRRSDCSSNQISIYHDAMKYAGKGDPYAMFIVGYLLNRGIRTKYSNPNVTLLEVDHQKALPWLKRAADAGIVEACWETACALSEAWYVPETVEDKMEEKLKYIMMGAEKDDTDCLEWLYKYSKDEHEQFMYLVRLADKHKTHQYTLELAKWYEEGKGCEKDEKKAFELAEYVYKHSSISPYDSSHEKAVSLLCRYLRDGIGCEPDPSRAADIRDRYESDEDDMMELLSR